VHTHSNSKRTWVAMKLLCLQSQGQGNRCRWGVVTLPQALWPSVQATVCQIRAACPGGMCRTLVSEGCKQLSGHKHSQLWLLLRAGKG
jgi:hypothetical protein